MYFSSSSLPAVDLARLACQVEATAAPVPVKRRSHKASATWRDKMACLNSPHHSLMDLHNMVSELIMGKKKTEL